MELQQGYETAGKVRQCGWRKPIFLDLDKTTALTFAQTGRKFMTRTVLLTDYAWRSSPDDPIRFTGWHSCTNPFATLDPPQSA